MMNTFHTDQYYLSSILFDTNWITAIIFLASNVKQRMLRPLPPCTLYTQPVLGWGQRIIGWLPIYTLYTQPMTEELPHKLRGYYHKSGWVCCYPVRGQRRSGWHSLFLFNSLPVVGWHLPFIHNTLPDPRDVVHNTGVVPP